MVLSPQHFTELTNGYEKTSSGLYTHKGRMEAAGLRLTQYLAPPVGSGPGLELGYIDPTGYIQSYDRTAAALRDLNIAARNLTLQPSGTLGLPAGSVGTSAIAANAVQQLVGQYVAVTSWSSASGGYVETPVQVSYTSSGVLTRTEFSVNLYNSSAGAYCIVAYGFDGVANQALAIPSFWAVNQPVSLSGVYYSTPTPGAHRIAMFIAVGGGTVTFHTNTVSTLYVTEQKR